MPTFELVTSFNQRLHKSEHQLIIDSVKETHPEAAFKVYHENSYEKETFGIECDLSWKWPNVGLVDVFEVNPWLKPLVNNFPPRTPKHGYWNSNAKFWVRKVAAWTHAVLNSNRDIVIWLDCDIRFNRKIPFELLKWTMDKKICSILRDRMHTETGVMTFATKSPQARLFATKVRDLYESREFEQLKRWDDCWTFDHVRKTSQVAGLTRAHGCPIDVPTELLLHLKDPLKQVRDKEPLQKTIP